MSFFIAATLGAGAGGRRLVGVWGGGSMCGRPRRRRQWRPRGGAVAVFGRRAVPRCQAPATPGSPGKSSAPTPCPGVEVRPAVAVTRWPPVGGPSRRAGRAGRR